MRSADGLARKASRRRGTRRSSWGLDAARAGAIERALEGVATPVFYRGLQIGERRRFSDRPMIAR